MSDPVLLTADRGAVRVLTVHRPDKLNALNAATLDALHQAFDTAASDPGVRAIVLTGSGPKAFVAGADIAEMNALSPVEGRDFSLRGQRMMRRVEKMPKPVIAMVNGFALGGGLELAMGCTVRFASDNAKLGQPEVKLGIIPGYGGTQRLPRLVGRGRALELMLSGDPIPAAEAYRIGLVNVVVPQAELLDYCRGWLGKVLANGPLALGLVMDAVDTGLYGGIEEGLRFEAAAFGMSAATEDSREGTRAFLEKRRAAFTGK